MSESSDQATNIVRWCKIGAAGLVVSVIGMYGALTNQDATQENEPGVVSSVSPAVTAPTLVLSSTPLTAEAPIATPSIIEPGGAGAAETPSPTYIPPARVDVDTPSPYIPPVRVQEAPVTEPSQELQRVGPGPTPRPMPSDVEYVPQTSITPTGPLPDTMAATVPTSEGTSQSR